MEISHSFDTLTSPGPQQPRHHRQLSDCCNVHALDTLPPPPSSIVTGKCRYKTKNICIYIKNIFIYLF